MSPRDPRPLWAWAEENVWLSAETGISRDHVGFYKSSFVPYTRGIQEAIMDPSTDWVAVMKGVQLTITECCLNAIRRIVAEGLGDVIFAIDSGDEVKKISEKRLKGTTFKDSPAIAKMVPDDPDKMQISTYYTKGSTVYLSGAGAAGKFANKPAPWVFLSELDKLPQRLGDEAGVWELAEDRRTSFDYGAQVGESQPATEEHKTNELFKVGTQEIYFVPCPHCGMHQELVWERLTFDHCKKESGAWDRKRMLKDTFYRCENEECPVGRIDEREKPWMLENGEWIATNPEALASERSFHISGLYSPMPRMKWGKLAQKWIRAKETESGRRNFRNSILGLPWQETMSNVDMDAIRRRLGRHKRGTIHQAPLYLAMLVDVQGDVYKWVKIAYHREPEKMGQCRMVIVDYGITLTRDELITEFDRGVMLEEAGEEPRRLVCQGGLIDSGYKAKTGGIYLFCAMSRGRFWPSKGRGNIQIRQTLNRSLIEHEGHELILYLYADDSYKGELYKDRIEKGDLGLELPADAEPAFLEEFTHEKHVRDRGRWVWVTDGTNDFADTVKMGQVLWSVIAPRMGFDIGEGDPDEEDDQADDEDAEIEGKVLETV